MTDYVYPQDEDELNMQESRFDKVTRGGLTKREYFAGLALQGIVKTHTTDGLNPEDAHEEIEEACRQAVQYADALIKELNK